MTVRNVVTWTAMIQGHVKCGKGWKALELFQQMQQEGLQPDAGTFVRVLNACASVTALEEGRRVHKQILHSGCESHAFVSSSLVDMYAKCGNMEDAWRVFHKIPTHNVVSWTAMILGLVKCGQGERALELFHQMQQQGVQPDPVTFVAVLNACASAMLLGNGRHIHEHIIANGCESNGFVGNSLVDMYVKCVKHPQMLEIHTELKRLSVQMHDAGCVPDTKFVLHDVEEEEKLSQLCYHSEKLAIAFGLINTPPGTPLCITKNLRVCSDCHTSIKFISKIVGRAIMVRDGNCFHQFQHGVCSCRDYW